ncbi:MAG TPA: hypothetical protein VH916_06475, partial [Dehalococcoidia bacterium]
SFLKHGILALGVCAALAAGTLGFGASAEARVPEKRNGPAYYKCLGIQGKFDSASELRERATSLKERYYWLDVMDAARAEWKQYGCDILYGNIAWIVKQLPTLEPGQHLGSVDGHVTPLTQTASQPSIGVDGGVIIN